MLEWLHRQVCFSFLYISSIHSGSCDRSGGGTMEWILILSTRHAILPITKWSFWRMWRVNTAPHIGVCQSIHRGVYWGAIQFPPRQLHDLVSHPLIHMICPAMMKITWHLTTWVEEHPDEEITQHAHCQPPGSIRIHHLMHQWSGGKFIQISMITTPT